MILGLGLTLTLDDHCLFSVTKLLCFEPDHHKRIVSNITTNFPFIWPHNLLSDGPETGCRSQKWIVSFMGQRAQHCPKSLTSELLSELSCERK